MAKLHKSIDKRNSMNKRQPRKSGRKGEIIEAAAKLFSNKSYHDVTMDQIAQEVGVAKGTIYLYFDSKEKLYDHLEVHSDVVSKKKRK